MQTLMKNLARYAGVILSTNEDDFVWTLNECLTCDRLLKATAPMSSRGCCELVALKGRHVIPIIATGAIGINLFARCYV